MIRSYKNRVPFIEQMQQSECSLCCLAMILSYYKYEVEISELRKAIEGGRNGVNLLTLKNLATHYDLDCQGKKVPFELLQNINTPCILFWNKKHYVVLEKINENEIIILDPAIGRIKIDKENFVKSYSGIVLTLSPSPKFSKKSRDTKDRYSYFKLFSDQKGIFCWIIVFSLFLQATTVMVPMFLKFIIDNVLIKQNLDLINILGVGSLCVLLIYFLFTFTYGKLLVKLQNSLDLSLMKRFISHLFSLPYKFFELRTSGDLMLRANSNVAIRQIISNQLITTIINILLVIFLTIYMFSQSIKLTLLILVIAFLEVVVILTTMSKQKLYTQTEVAFQANTNGFLTEAIRGVSVIKSLGVGNEVNENWRSLFSEQIQATNNKLSYQNNVNSIIKTLNFAAPLSVAWLGTLLVLDGHITLGTLFAFQSLVVTFLAPFTSLATSFGDIVKVETLLGRIRDILKTEPEQTEKLETIEDLSGEITLDNVCFNYDGSKINALKNINLQVNERENVAIVGKTGSGKSTLASLLVGLYVPTSGDVKFDRKSISILDKNSLRKIMGIVMQEDFLFNKTIKDNIAMYNSSLSMNDIIKSAKLAEIHDDIIQMSMGYETLVSETGSNISGGQRQRIVLARAIANNPSILLLDEATSALDNVTEKLISDNLGKLNCTRIVIAHRLSTVVNADKIIVMDNGEIVETGTHHELLNNSFYYQELFNTKSEITSGEVASI